MYSRTVATHIKTVWRRPPRRLVPQRPDLCARAAPQWPNQCARRIMGRNTRHSALRRVLNLLLPPPLLALLLLNFAVPTLAKRTDDTTAAATAAAAASTAALPLPVPVPVVPRTFGNGVLSSVHNPPKDGGVGSPALVVLNHTLHSSSAYGVMTHYCE